jgi:hypothetical protein
MRRQNSIGLQAISQVLRFSTGDEQYGLRRKREESFVQARAGARASAPRQMLAYSAEQGLCPGDCSRFWFFSNTGDAFTGRQRAIKRIEECPQ